MGRGGMSAMAPMSAGVTSRPSTNPALMVSPWFSLPNSWMTLASGAGSAAL